MWQFIQIVTNVNTKVKIFLNVFVTLISKCDTIFKMWQYFQNVTLFLKVWHYFQIVTLFSKCHTIFKMSHFFSKCHTIFQMSHMMHFSESVTFVTKIIVLSHFFSLHFGSSWLDVTNWCHTLCPSFIGLFLSRPEVSNVSNFVHIINTWTIFCTSHRCTWTCGWTTRNFDAFVNGKWNWSNSNYDHGIEPHDREIHYSPPSNHFHGL